MAAGARRPAAPWRCKKASIRRSPSALNTEQVRRAAGRRAPAGGHSASSICACIRASAGDVVGAAQPAHVGVAAHDARGAARRVEQDRVERPAVPPRGGGARVGGAQVRGCRPRRFSVSSHARQASGSLSSASTSRSASSSRWAVLPPGAAQASSTRGRRAGRRRAAGGAARCAAASCTDTSPSAKPGSCGTGHGLRPAPPPGGPTGRRRHAGPRREPLHVRRRPCRGAR